MIKVNRMVEAAVIDTLRYAVVYNVPRTMAHENSVAQPNALKQ